MDHQTAQALAQSAQFWMWIIGIIVMIIIAFYQGLNYVQQKRNTDKFSDLCEEIRDLWKRANNHGHKIECDGPSCKPRTVGVIIEHE